MFRRDGTAVASDFRITLPGNGEPVQSQRDPRRFNPNTGITRGNLARHIPDQRGIARQNQRARDRTADLGT